VFANGVHSEYDGSRTSAAIVEFMRRKADPDFRPPPEAVVSLTSDAFDAFVAKHPLFLVAFVTPSCGHCQRLAPEYERAAQQLAEVWPPIPLTKVDVSLERALAERFSVSAFPTLFVFRKGKHVTYRGGRDETAIVRFMRAQQNTPSKVVSSLAELRKALTPDWPTVVAFLGDSSPFLDVWEEAAFAGKERNYKFLHVTDADVTSAAGESADSIVVFSGQWFESKTHRMPFVSIFRLLSRFLTLFRPKDRFRDRRRHLALCLATLAPSRGSADAVH
jgi:protein disulfide-isomerase A4